MDVAASFLGTPVADLSKWCIGHVKRQAGYIVHYKHKIEQLNEKIQELKENRDDVLDRVRAANNNLEDIDRVLKTWLQNVEKATTTPAGNHRSRYNLGRGAAKKILIIDQLLNERNSFGDRVPPRRLIVADLPHSNNQDDVEPFASRDHLKDEVMAALRDEGTNLIGIYGMGGVGKTTLATQVYNQVKNDRKNLFDEVVMITISQKVDLIKLQNDIAERLGFDDLKTKGNVSVRADLLSERQKLRCTLVILDDLWSPLEFSDVGIPCGQNGCKVIITTRKLDVCTRLGSTKNINVAVLAEKDAWNLFRKKVGDLADAPDLKETAEKIAKECRGLPVALVTLGKGLRNKSKAVWENTLRELRNSKTTLIEDMEPKVFKSIKLSFDYLEKDIFKKMFLLCCLFPEDHEIGVADLMAYVVGDDTMLGDEETLKQKADMVLTVLDKLVDSCLLLRNESDDDDKTYTVTMHDVIRDVAIYIASQEQYGFLVKAGFGLKDWPATEKVSSCLRLSLMYNEITVLPTEPPELPLLKSLSLTANESEIPDSFFERMGSLATLDLRYTGISSLPSSLEFLLNLKILYLDYCKFNQSTDISVIGKLKKLEILSLANCEGLYGLPGEIRELTNLRFLDLERYSDVDFTMPKNVISNLLRLEYLNVSGCKIKQWEVEGSGNGKIAFLDEVASLPCLSGLSLRFNDYENEKEEISVTIFSIDFSDATDIMPNRNNEATVDASIPFCHSINVLIQKVEILDLRTCPGLKSVGHLGVGFNNLKELHVARCRELENVMSFVGEAQNPIRPFIALETLHLISLCRMKRVFVGPIPMGFLDKLSLLEIHNCDKMDSIFDSKLGRRVPNMERLQVSSCDGLKDVFNFEEIGTSTTLNDEDAGLSDDFKFSKLREMTLQYLPALENIWNGCIPPIGCFENLQEMTVSGCPQLRCLFSTSIARNLQKLKKLRIWRCRGMVQLVTLDEQMVKIFPSLQMLEIKDCENLKQLWDIIGMNLGKEEGDFDQLAMTGESSILDFPCLEFLKVVKCENLKRILLTHQCTQQLMEIEGESEEWFEQVLEWEDPTDKLHMKPLFKIPQ